jgi:Asparagine synthase (glutamine-hydrolyzing)
MIGLCAIIARRQPPSPDQLRGLFSQSHNATEIAATNVGPSCIAHGENGDIPAAEARDEHCVCMAVGDIYDDGSSAARSVLNAYRTGGVAAATSLNGSYAFILHDAHHRRTVVGCDANAVIPVYYTQSEDSVIISWDAYAIMALMPRGPEIDESTLTIWLLYGGRGFGDRTRFCGIKRLEPGSAIVAEDSTITIQRATPFHFTPDDTHTDTLLDEAAHALIRAVEARTRDRGRVFLGLSGGLDSRIVLAAGKSETERFMAYTYGPKRFVERDIARQVAACFDIPHLSAETVPDDFRETAREGVRLSGGASLFKHGVQAHLFRSLKEQHGGDGIMLGSALDLLLGGTFLPDEAFSMNGGVELADLLTTRLANYPDDVWNSLFLDRAKAAQHRENARETLRQCIVNIPGDTAADINDAFSFDIRIKRWYNHNLIYMLTDHRLLLPSYDREFLDIMSRVPGRQRQGSRFRVRLLERLSEQAAGITWDATMRPANLPREEAEACKAEVRAMDDALPPGTSDRHEANFRDWIRTEDTWSSFFRELLVGKDAVMTTALLSRKGLEALIDSHIRGTHNWHKQLVMLASAEILFRLQKEPPAPQPVKRRYDWTMSNPTGGHAKD